MQDKTFHAMTSTLFEMSAGQHRFYSVIMALVAVLSMGCLTISIVYFRTAPTDSICMAIGGTLFLLLMVPCFQATRFRLELGPSFLRYRKYFKTLELSPADIKGFRIEDNGFGPFVECETFSSGQRHTLHLITSDHEEILDRLATRFDWLDPDDLEREEVAVLSNPLLGSTEEEREANLEDLHEHCRGLNTVAGGLSLWCLFAPSPSWAILVLIGLPILGLLLRLYYGELIYFDTDPSGLRPGIGFAVVMPAVVLTARGLIDWNILDWKSLFLPSILATGIVWAAFFCLDARQKVQRPAVHQVLILVFCAFFGLGATLTLNGFSDTSPPDVHRAEVCDKRISDTDGPTFYELELCPWGPLQQGSEANVSKSLFQQVSVGQDIEVLVRSGRFGIAWYEAKAVGSPQR